MSSNIKDIILAALFTAFIAVGAMITVPFGPIPFTLQTFAITLVLFIGKPKTALLAMAIYVILGAIGAPVFASFKGGIGVLLGPTGGFLLGYLIGIYPMAFAISKIKSDNKVTSNVLVIVCGIALTLIAYTIGTIQFMTVANASVIVALSTCVIPFALIDLCKIIVAWSISLLVKKHLVND